jgi:predicted RNase H-like HicB family nuclease
MEENIFVFTGYLIKEGETYTSFCPEVDIASEGITTDEARKNIMEAVSLYVESAIESNLPVIRPVPYEEDPKKLNPDSVVETFRLKIDFDIKVYA